MVEAGIFSGMSVVPVLLSGGSGSRLWPVSKQENPKQFLKFSGEQYSLIQKTVRRVADNSLFSDPVVMASHAHRFTVAEQLQNIAPNSKVITEPVARNTAAAMMVAAIEVAETYGPDTPMLFMPADHLMPDDIGFSRSIKVALNRLSNSTVTVFGVSPTNAETGYGYIHCSDLASGEVISFTEKPSQNLAQSYVESEEYYWNSGMFMATAGCVMRLVRCYQVALAAYCHKALSLARRDEDFIRLDGDSYALCKDISFDYAVMERAKNAQMVPLLCDWADLGSWESIWRASPKDDAGNAIHGDALLVDSQNCYVHNESAQNIAVLGVSNANIVATGDDILVSDMSKSQQVKELSAQITPKQHRVERPWGYFESLYTGDKHQVKRLSLLPSAMISLQMHRHRSEHWVVVRGIAEVVCDDMVRVLHANESIDIPQGAKHRLTNLGDTPLEVIEVQSGEYLGEDDIIRFEDYYGRQGEVA